MSFAIWFLILGAISLGIGSLVAPWMESATFRLLWAPGIAVSGLFRYLGARAAGLPVSQVQLFSGHGRGVRVDVSGANAIRKLAFSAISFLGPIGTFLAVNQGMGAPIRLGEPLPGLVLDGRMLITFGNQAGAYLYEVWSFLTTVLPTDPIAIVLLYIFVGILLSNAPGKGESAPLFVFVFLIGAIHLLGVTLRRGSQVGEVSRAIWYGLGLTLAYSLLALAIAGLLAAIYRARHGPDSGKAR